MGAGSGGGIGHAGGVLFVGDALKLVHILARAEAKTANGHHIRPLIQAELTPIYINGVPRHIHLH